MDLNVILGGLAGAVAAACVGLLLFYMRKHPQKAMKAHRAFWLCIYMHGIPFYLLALPPTQRSVAVCLSGNMPL